MGGTLAILTTVVALIGSSPQARTQEDQHSPTDMEAMGLAEKWTGDYVAAVNAHDAAKAATYYAPEGELVISEGIKVVRRPKGPAAVEGYYKPLFSENPQLRLKLTVESAHLVTPDVLTSGGTIEVTGISGEAIQGRFFTVSK